MVTPKSFLHSCLGNVKNVDFSTVPFLISINTSYRAHLKTLPYDDKASNYNFFFPTMTCTFLQLDRLIPNRYITHYTDTSGFVIPAQSELILRGCCRHFCHNAPHWRAFTLLDKGWPALPQTQRGEVGQGPT